MVIQLREVKRIYICHIKSKEKKESSVGSAAIKEVGVLIPDVVRKGRKREIFSKKEACCR